MAGGMQPTADHSRVASNAACNAFIVAIIRLAVGGASAKQAQASPRVVDAAKSTKAFTTRLEASGSARAFSMACVVLRPSR